MPPADAVNRNFSGRSRSHFAVFMSWLKPRPTKILAARARNKTPAWRRPLQIQIRFARHGVCARRNVTANSKP